MALTEKQIDRQLERGLYRLGFSSWFLHYLKIFEPAKLVLCRSDHPWGSVPVPTRDPVTGEEQTINLQSETDVLAVFELESGRRVGVHIENKLANGHFTPRQAEMYAVRAKHWIGSDKHGRYMDGMTTLVAPHAFVARHLSDVKLFDAVIPYEDIARCWPDLG